MWKNKWIPVYAQRIKVLYVTTIALNRKNTLYFQKPPTTDGTVVLKSAFCDVRGVFALRTEMTYAGRVYSKYEIQTENGFGTELGTVTLVLKNSDGSMVYLHTNISGRDDLTLKQVHETARLVGTRPGTVSAM